MQLLIVWNKVDLNHTFPSEDIQQRFAEIARNLGDPNIFTEVRPTLRLMLQEFKRLPLTSVLILM